MDATSIHAEIQERVEGKDFGDIAAYYAALTGAYQATVDRLCWELRCQGDLVNGQKAELSRLYDVERAANELVDELEKAGQRRKHTHGPATTLEIEEKREDLRAALERDVELEQAGVGNG